MNAGEMTPSADLSPAPNPLLAVRRRLKPMLLVGSAVLAVTLLAALLWPPRYSATGTILIEQQELPSDLVRSTVSSYASQRVQVISQRVMTTENLTGIIQRYDLYPKMRKWWPREEVIKEMRDDTNLKMISADVIDPRNGNPTKATIAFSISYSNHSAELASKVANELVSLYLQQNIESRQQSSRDAAVFLTDESTRLDKEIKEQQAKLAQFKEKHADELPELTQMNLGKISRLEDDIRNTDTQLSSLDRQVTFLDAQLAQLNPTAQVYASTGERVQSPADRLKYLRSEYARVVALYSAEHPDVKRVKRELEGLEAAAAVDDASGQKGESNDLRRQLEDAQTQLASAKERYSADHPDVVRLERLVESLQQRLAARPSAAAPAASEAAAGPVDAAPNLSADNPPYIQIQAQRHATASEIAALRKKRDDLQRELASVERHVGLTPVVERDYSAMLRDLESAQTEYRQVRLKQMEAQTAEDLEVERKAEHFTLIEPPFPPQEPTSPNRPLIFLFGLAAALAAGFGTAALLEVTDGSVRGRHDLMTLLATSPLAMIPVMLTNADRVRKRRWRVRALLGGAAGVVVALVLIHVLYRPLDVLALVALHRLGIEAQL